MRAARQLLASLLLLMADATSGDAAPPQSKVTRSKVRWGIMGTGSIASDFTKVLKQLDDVEVAAVGSRTVERAAEFANALELDTTTTTLHASYEVTTEHATRGPGAAAQYRHAA